MVQMLNRKMPTRRTAYGYLALACLLALLYSLQPVAVLSIILAVSFATAGVLSIPRLNYPKVLLCLIFAGIIPAAITYFLTRSLPLCLAAFSFAPASALLALTVRRRNSRSAGIFWTSVALGGVLLAAILLWIYQAKGSLSFEVFKEIYNQGCSLFVENLAPMLEPVDGSLLLTQIDPEEYAKQIYEQIVLILPGVFILLVWITAWLSTVVLRWIFMNYVYGSDRFAVWPVTVNRPLAWIYISAFLIASLAASLAVNSIVYAIAIVCNNIYLILMPQFVIVGCRTVKERILKAPGCGCMTFVLLGVCIFSLPMLPTLLAFTGAFRTIAPTRPIPPSSNSENPPDQGGNPS